PTAEHASVLAWDSRDYSRAYVRLADVPADGTIVLRGGIAVDVLVLGPAGEPVTEAVVELRCLGATVETVRAPGGRARLNAVDHATDPSWVVARSGALRGAVRVVRTDTPVEVRLRAPFALEVRVSDAATRAPLAGAEVVPFGADQAGPVRTGDDGAARLPVPALDGDADTAGVEFLVVRAKGYAEAIRFVYGANPSKPIEIPMARARRLRVLVLDGAGAPVGGAQVLLLDSRPTYALDASAAVRLAPERTTDASGVAEVEGLRLDTRVDVVAFAPARGWASTQIGPGDAPGEIKLVLVPGRSLSVRVSDPEGAPVPGARVASLQSGSPPLGGVFVDSVCAATTDGAGIADLRDVPSGSEELTVSADGWFLRRVEFEPAAPRVDVTLLRRATIEGRIEGVAARTDGAAHRIRAMPLGRPNPYDEKRTKFNPPNALADDTGRFRLDGCVPGTEYVVSIVGLSDENAGPGTVRVVAPATDVVLRGADAQWARVVLVFPEADTPRGVHVEANGRDRSGKPVILRLATPPKLSDATFELQLPHGEVALRVTAMDACTWADDVRVVEDGQRVSVPIRAAPRLSIQVVDPRGEPVVDAEVRIEIAPTQPLDAAGRPRPHLWGSTARTSSDGTCTLPPPWHRFRLSVWKDRASYTTPERGVDETDPLRIVFDPLATPPPRAPDADGGR
ncbi:MAG TPA: carboxypeptidase-like regulatory domain-containing protein, partial [Planctomycetota bacterium]|nr:carboxypeptidase-like regulatory domain-containing protein [Planctomycetota bacterium]